MIKHAKNLGFDFHENRNKSFGFLRAFVKAQKQSEGFKNVKDFSRKTVWKDNSTNSTESYDDPTENEGL